MREGWQAALPSFEAGKQIATRSAGQKAMAALSPFGPTMAGGAADLVESTKTVFEGAGEYSRVHTGRNIPFGIREHAMGAIVNGLAAHGGMVKPYGSTFLIFSDYMRPSVRLSALMELPVMWVWTHDSVGLGEDGPTHQPVEHYAALRAIPHLWVIRPADANETAARMAGGAWSVRMAPSRCCSRARTCPSSTAREWVAPTAWSAVGMSCGSLRVRVRCGCGCGCGRDAARAGEAQGPTTGTPELVLIATGSEVAPTLQAARSSPPREPQYGSSRCPAWSSSKLNRPTTATA